MTNHTTEATARQWAQALADALPTVAPLSAATVSTDEDDQWVTLVVTAEDGARQRVTFRPVGRPYAQEWTKVEVRIELARELWEVSRYGEGQPRACVSTNRDPVTTARDIARRVIMPGWTYLAQVQGRADDVQARVQRADEAADRLMAALPDGRGWRAPEDGPTRKPQASGRWSGQDYRRAGWSVAAFDGAEVTVSLDLDGLDIETAERVLSLMG